MLVSLTRHCLVVPKFVLMLLFVDTGGTGLSPRAHEPVLRGAEVRDAEVPALRLARAAPGGAAPAGARMPAARRGPRQAALLSRRVSFVFDPSVTEYANHCIILAWIEYWTLDRRSSSGLESLPWLKVAVSAATLHELWDPRDQHALTRQMKFLTRGLKTPSLERLRNPKRLTGAHAAR